MSLNILVHFFTQYFIVILSVYPLICHHFLSFYLYFSLYFQLLFLLFLDSSKWEWKKDFMKIIHNLAGLRKLQAKRPSTAAIGDFFFFFFCFYFYTIFSHFFLYIFILSLFLSFFCCKNPLFYHIISSM